MTLKLKSKNLTQELMIEKAEISFTFHYCIGGILRLGTNKDKEGKNNQIHEDIFRLNEAEKYIIPRENWDKSAIAHYISDNFLNVLMITHFHLDLNKIPKKVNSQDSYFHKTEEHQDIFFIPTDFPYEKKDNSDGIKSIAAKEKNTQKN